MEQIYEFSMPKNFGATYKLSTLAQPWSLTICTQARLIHTHF
jgi:hypothetical protein